MFKILVHVVFLFTTAKSHNLVQFYLSHCETKFSKIKFFFTDIQIFGKQNFLKDHVTLKTFSQLVIIVFCHKTRRLSPNFTKKFFFLNSIINCNFRVYNNNALLFRYKQSYFLKIFFFFQNQSQNTNLGLQFRRLGSVLI